MFRRLRPALFILALVAVAIAPTTACATPEVARKVSRWGCKVEVDGQFRGSGTFCGQWVLTCAHLFHGDNSKVVIKTSYGLTCECTAVIDRSRDLAALLLPEGVAVKGPKWTAKCADVGERLYVTGCPGGLDFSVTQGIVSFKGRKLGTHFGVTWDDVDQTDAAVLGGSSGGGVYLQTGQLTGVLVAGRTDGGGHNFYVPMRVVREFASDRKLRNCCPILASILDYNGSVSSERQKMAPRASNLPRGLAPNPPLHRPTRHTFSVTPITPKG